MIMSLFELRSFCISYVCCLYISAYNSIVSELKPKNRWTIETKVSHSALLLLFSTVLFLCLHTPLVLHKIKKKSLITNVQHSMKIYMHNKHKNYLKRISLNENKYVLMIY